MAGNVLATHGDLLVIAEHIEVLVGEMAEKFVASLRDGRSGRSVNDRAELVVLESQLASVMRLVEHFETLMDADEEHQCE
jgi:hypothetical protein